MKPMHLLAIAALAPGLAAAADFTGTWKLDNAFNGKVSVVHCTLVQAADALTGSCQPEGMAATALTGKVSGASARWGYELVFNGKPARVDFEVTLAADGSISGNLLRNGGGSPIRGVREKR